MHGRLQTWPLYLLVQLCSKFALATALCAHAKKQLVGGAPACAAAQALRRPGPAGAMW